MATLILVGGRDAAIRTAQEAGHRVVLVSDRKPLRRRREQLLGFVELDIGATDQRALAPCVRELESIAAKARLDIDGVLAATERAVLPAAHLRKALSLAGNSPESAFLCRNKLAMKESIRAAGIPCADFAGITKRTTAISLITRLGLPLVIKPADSSGSRGATLAKRQRDVERHLTPGMVAESFVHGLEMSVESFVSEGEVVFTNITEYLLPLWANVVPASLPTATLKAVHALNQRAIATLGIRRGMTHLELFLTSEGPVFSELAVRPPGGYLMELLQMAYGFDPWRTVIDVELGKPVRLPQRAHKYAGMWLLHPGPGTVKRVSGFRACQSLRGIAEVSCRVAPGDTLRQREGSGESAAYFLAEGETRRDVVSTLEKARRTLAIELES
jgi:biotin carboxylase